MLVHLRKCLGKVSGIEDLSPHYNDLSSIGTFKNCIETCENLTDFYVLTPLSLLNCVRCIKVTLHNHSQFQENSTELKTKHTAPLL